MIVSETQIQDAHAPASWQFSVSSLLWLMVTAGMCLAYARLYGPPAVTLVLTIPLSAAVIGAVSPCGTARELRFIGLLWRHSWVASA